MKDMKGMKDVQSQSDRRRVGIHKVGVKDLRYPISILDRQNAAPRNP